MRVYHGDATAATRSAARVHALAPLAHSQQLWHRGSLQPAAKSPHGRLPAYGLQRQHPAANYRVELFLVELLREPADDSGLYPGERFYCFFDPSAI